MKYEYKIIEKTDDYTIVEAQLKGEIINMRFCSDGFCEFQFNDAFCRTFGCKDREDWLIKNPKVKMQMLQFFGYIPEWVMVLPGGGFGISKMIERQLTKFGKVSLT